MPSITTSPEPLPVDKLGNTILQEDQSINNSPTSKLEIESSHSRSVSSLGDLPLELLIVIFSNLEPRSLKNISLVCKSWNNLSKDNIMWMHIFKERFPNLKDTFPSVSRSRKWRKELIKRETLIKSWRKGKGTHNSYSIANLFYITDLFTDFKNNKLVTFNKNTGNLMSCNLNNGSNQDFYPSCFPSGTTSYTLSKNCIMFGRWDGKIYGSLINYRNILVSGIKEYKESEHVGLVTRIHINQSELAKEGKVGALTADENGYLLAWDIKKGVKISKVRVSTFPIIKIESNYRDEIVVLNNRGELYLISNMFNLFDCTPKVTKLATFNDAIVEPVSITMYVDYGDQNVILISDSRLTIYSYKQNLFGSSRILHLDEGEDAGTPDGIIYRSSIEQNNKYLTPRDDKIVGHDPLMLGLLLKSGKVLVVNVRDPKYEIQPSLSFYPNLITQDDDYQSVLLSQQNIDLPPLSEISINSMVLMVGSYNGRLEMYDVCTGCLFRKVSDKINKSLMQSLEHQLVPLTSIQLDEARCTGLVVFGSIVQVFQFGDFYKELDQKRKQKLRTPSNSLSSVSGSSSAYNKDSKNTFLEVKKNLEDYQDELETDAKHARLLDKYNGKDMVDSDEEFQMALALSVSMSNSQTGTTSNSVNHSRVTLDDDEDEELAKVLQLSKNETTSFVANDDDDVDGNLLQRLQLSTQNQADDNQDLDGNEDDEELRRAIELSKLETSRLAKQPAVGQFDEEDDELGDDLKLALELSKTENQRVFGSGSNGEGSSSSQTFY